MALFRERKQRGEERERESLDLKEERIEDGGMVGLVYIYRGCVEWLTLVYTKYYVAAIVTCNYVIILISL